MEVLISMFVLTVGLLGVAALIPAGRHEIVEAAKLDNASMVGRAAFRDMQVRGYMNPNNWYRRPTPTPPPNLPSVYDPAATLGEYFTVRNTGGINVPSQHAAYCLDPLGRTAPIGTYLFDFPLTAAGGSNPPALMRIVPFASPNLDQARAAYDTIFRSSFDLVTQPNANNEDLPSVPQWFRDPPLTGTRLRRMSEGNYSWLATIVSDQSRPAVSSDVTVSVAVFYKRDLSGTGEYTSGVVDPFPVFPLTSGSSLQVNNLPTDLSGRIKPLRPGQWIMLAGYKMTTGAAPVQLNYYRWYKVLSAANYDTATTTQNITIAGQDWSCPAANTQVWIFDNIVNVYEKQLPLELN